MNVKDQFEKQWGARVAKPSLLLFSIVFLLLGVSLTIQSYLSVNNRSKEPVQTNSKRFLEDDRVIALGRLEPQGKIIRLSPTSSGQRLMKLLVKEGDEVRVNQIIAIVEDARRYQASVDNAKTKVNVFQMRLAQLQAGQKAGDIESQRRKVAEMQAKLMGRKNAQQAAIAQQEIALLKARQAYQRYFTLAQQGAVSKSEAEDRRLQVEIEQKKLQESQATFNEQINTSTEQVAQTQATLESLMNVRTTDTAVAEAELEEARAQLRQAEVDLESAYVRVPSAGQILAVNTQAGEVVGANGIADLGQTQQMIVTAEVYEKDIRSIKVGQSATIVSEYGGFEGELSGAVDAIKLRIDKPEIINDDPATKSDARVVQVKIRLSPNDSSKVRHLSNLQVRAFISVR